MKIKKAILFGAIGISLMCCLSAYSLYSDFGFLIEYKFDLSLSIFELSAYVMILQFFIKLFKNQKN